MRDSCDLAAGPGQVRLCHDTSPETAFQTSYAGSIPVARSTRTSAIAGEQAFVHSRGTDLYLRAPSCLSPDSTAAPRNEACGYPGDQVAR